MVWQPCLHCWHESDIVVQARWLEWRYTQVIEGCKTSDGAWIRGSAFSEGVCDKHIGPPRVSLPNYKEAE